MNSAKLQEQLKIAHTIAKLMDTRFQFFGIRFGLDSIIGLVPGVGDSVSLVFSFFLIRLGFQIGVPSSGMFAMFRNVLIDTFFGTIPVLGDISDIFFKANIKNLEIIEKHLQYTESKNSAGKQTKILEGEVIS